MELLCVSHAALLCVNEAFESKADPQRCAPYLCFPLNMWVCDACSTCGEPVFFWGSHPYLVLVVGGCRCVGGGTPLSGQCRKTERQGGYGGSPSRTPRGTHVFNPDRPRGSVRIGGWLITTSPQRPSSFTWVWDTRRSDHRNRECICRAGSNMLQLWWKRWFI